MVRRWLNAIIFSAGLVALAVVFFFVPLGRRTLFEHVRRISATPEAQELGTEVDEASERVEGAVREKVRDLTRDAGLDAR